VDERLAPSDTPASEAIATTGLFLNIASVIAVTVSLASWGASDAVIAAVAGVTAVLTFVGSLICFGKQAGDHESQQAA
jgi:hypothetical protein